MGVFHHKHHHHYVMKIFTCSRSCTCVINLHEMGQCRCPSDIANSPLNPRSLVHVFLSNSCATRLHNPRFVMIKLISVIWNPSLWPLTTTPTPSDPQRLLNSAASTEEQTNKTPRGGTKATSGNGQRKRSPAY